MYPWSLTAVAPTLAPFKQHHRRQPHRLDPFPLSRPATLRHPHCCCECAAESEIPPPASLPSPSPLLLPNRSRSPVISDPSLRHAFAIPSLPPATLHRTTPTSLHLLTLAGPSPVAPPSPSRRDAPAIATCPPAAISSRQTIRVSVPPAALSRRMRQSLAHLVANTPPTRR